MRKPSEIIVEVTEELGNTKLNDMGTSIPAIFNRVHLETGDYNVTAVIIDSALSVLQTHVEKGLLEVMKK